MHNNQKQLPSVTIIILNYNGLSHLQTCFDSLKQLAYPHDKLEIMFVDNGSHDGSEAFVRQRYPDIKVIQNNANLGFAEGNNVGAQAAKGEIIVFLNNDTRVESNWLRELVTPMMADDQVACTASKILDWDGNKIDFVQPSLNFHGFAHQVAWRMPVEPDHYNESNPLIMACGGSMAIRRQVFLDSGGFDKDFFVFYEDVDLGWRLWVLGYKIVFTPKAITYHRHHSTSNNVSLYRKMFLYERNALYMIIKNYEDLNLDKILPAALFLAIHRATDAIGATGADPETYHPDNWGTLSEKKLKQKVPLTTTVPLLAARDVIANLPRLMEKRAQIQAKRQRTDAEILPLFGQPLKMYTMAYHTNDHYAIAQGNLINAFQLDQIFTGIGKNILIFTSVGLPRFGFSPTDQGSRLETFGDRLSQQGHSVTYSMPKAIVADNSPSATVSDIAWDPLTTDQLVIRLGPDILIASDWRPLDKLNKGAYRPIILDTSFLELTVETSKKGLENQQLALEKVDLYICLHEKQRQSIHNWLSELGVNVAWSNIHVIDPDASIEVLYEFCRHPYFTGVKPAQPPATPLIKLPLRAWQIVSGLGPRALFEEIRRYVQWRFGSLKRQRIS